MLQRNSDPPYPAPEEASGTVAEGSQHPTFDLRELGRILRRRYRLVALPPAVLVGLALGYVLAATTLYTATSTVLVDPRRANVVETNQSVLSNFGTDDATIESQVLLIQSGAALQRVVDNLKLTEDPEFRRPPGMLADIRFNDGACDPVGRFWAGTVAGDRRAGAGALYRLDPSGEMAVVLDGVTESNGLGWSPDGGTFYFIDSGEPRPRIRAFPCDLAAGTLGAPRDLVQPPPEQGIPDGLMVDAAGCVWVAFWGGHAVRRYSPAGELLAELPVPVSQPSCPALGGPDLADLYVTTAWEDMTQEQRAAEPLAGHLLRARANGAGPEGAGLDGVRGQPAGQFGG